MSKKDYELIARVVRQVGKDLDRTRIDIDTVDTMILGMAAAFADALEGTSFDRERFIAACIA